MRAGITFCSRVNLDIRSLTLELSSASLIFCLVIFVFGSRFFGASDAEVWLLFEATVTIVGEY
jgi:hypothetical protein